MTYLKFKNGKTIPQLGFGTYQLEGDEVTEPLTTALEIGFRHIDTADRYFNHKEIGKVLDNSGIERSDLFLTTKIWNDKHDRNGVKESIDRSLTELRTDYLDLVLIHWPVKDVPVSETLEMMMEAVDKKLVRSIGVSNFTIHHLEDVKALGIEIVNNQVEFHPSLNQKELKDYCDKNEILLTAYSPLGEGADLEIELLVELGKKYNVSSAQICLAWILNKGIITIPKSSKRERIQQNWDAQNINLDKEDIKAIDNLNLNNRVVKPQWAEFEY